MAASGIERATIKILNMIPLIYKQFLAEYTIVTDVKT